MADYDPSTDPAMQALFEKADAEGLWFCSVYQDLWFSPSELRAAQAEDRFLLGPENWTLRDPSERLRRLKSEAEIALHNLSHFRRRMTDA